MPGILHRDSVFVTSLSVAAVGVIYWVSALSQFPGAEAGSLWWRFAFYEFLSLITVATATVMIARRTKLPTWLLWVVVATLSGGFMSAASAPPGERLVYVFSGGMLWRSTGVGALFDFAALCLVGAVGRQWPRPERDGHSAAAWLLVASIAAALAALAFSPDMPPEEALVALRGAVLGVAFAAITRTSRPTFPALTLLVGIWAGGLSLHLFGIGGTLRTYQWVVVLLTFVVAMVGAAERTTLALGRSGITSWLVLNGLNIVDAMATRFGLTAGRVEELNPFVLDMGFAVKIIGVAAVSAVVARTKPTWMPIPIAAYVGVLVWHVVGGLRYF